MNFDFNMKMAVSDINLLVFCIMRYCERRGERRFVVVKEGEKGLSLFLIASSRTVVNVTGKLDAVLD